MASGTHLTTQAIFSLEEPWRSRFLVWVADRAGRQITDTRTPTPEQVTTWLDEHNLSQKVQALLAVWTGQAV